jgi:PadR family transcriptional regulator, regulatory protein PadR
VGGRLYSGGNETVDSPSPPVTSDRLTPARRRRPPSETSLHFRTSSPILSHKILMALKEPPSGEMLRDTLDMLVLKTLQRGPMHGYGIAEFIEERSEDVLRVEEGALYPALHRLELRGLLASEWGVSDNRRRAKFYRLTAAGRKQLQKDSARWGLISAAIGRIMETA